jgi:ribosome-associated heat shock protein Hsp15
VRVGDTVTVRLGLVERTLIVRGMPENRVGAKLVVEYCEDRTPPEQFAKAQENRVEQFLAREKGSGRPTKRDRRLIERLIRP